MRTSAAIGIVAVVLLLVISVCGCTTQNSTPANQSSSTTLGYAAVNVTAKTIVISQQIGSSSQTGYKFVAYNCTVKFVNATGRLTGADYWLLRDTQDDVYTRSNATFSTEIKGYPSLHTGLNDTVSGTIVYEVPQNVTLKSLTYDDLVSNATITL